MLLLNPSEFSDIASIPILLVLAVTVALSQIAFWFSDNLQTMITNFVSFMVPFVAGPLTFLSTPIIESLMFVYGTVLSVMNAPADFWKGWQIEN
mmetsp:Transcript_6132/g.9840  ORF Transcript_6132/g.9840 Transcript_6132/m.9840 type:complete len:94 (-) Transcript_6132:602-883(-)